MIKKIYIQPSMIEVKLQHQSIICESVTGLRGNGGLGYGGDDASYVEGGGDVRTRESSGIWDEEW